MKANKNVVIINAIILVFLASFIFIAEYSRPPVGDDVLSQFKNGVNYYLDNEENDCGQLCSSIIDAFQIAKDTYFLWGGRLLGFFLGSFRTLVGDIFIAIFTSIIYLSIILISCYIVRKSWIEVFLHPLDYVFLFIVTFYLNIGIGYLLMWTMVTIYSLSVLLILVYGAIQDKFYKTDEKRTSVIFLYNLLGFIAGITQEIYVGLICVFLLINFIVNKEERAQIFRYNIGFVLGTLICFFSPGNFNRSLQSHEIALNLSYLQRLEINIYTHFNNLAGIRYICALFILAVFAFLLYKFLRYRSLRIDKVLYLWMELLVLSVFAWAAVATPQNYSMIFFVVFSWILIMQLFIDNCEYYSSLSYIKSGIVSFCILIVLAFYNTGWLASNFKTRLTWNQLIDDAVVNHQEMVEVPKFEENYSNRFNMNNYNNNSEEFLTNYYLKYYKVKIVPTAPLKYSKNKN